MKAVARVSTIETAPSAKAILRKLIRLDSIKNPPNTRVIAKKSIDKYAHVLDENHGNGVNHADKRM